METDREQIGGLPDLGALSAVEPEKASQTCRTCGGALSGKGQCVTCRLRARPQLNINAEANAARRRRNGEAFTRWRAGLANPTELSVAVFIFAAVALGMGSPLFGVGSPKGMMKVPWDPNLPAPWNICFYAAVAIVCGAVAVGLSLAKRWARWAGIAAVLIYVPLSYVGIGPTAVVTWIVATVVLVCLCSPRTLKFIDKVAQKKAAIAASGPA